MLLLDDRPDDRELLATLLGYAGYRVIEAATGEEALSLAAQRRPDLIISDILMPGMNGYEFVRRLRADPDVARTPVVFCTANYLEREVHELAQSVGVARFISKPCPPEVVLETVSEALGEPGPASLPEPPGPEFEREQLRIINDKLVEKVAELEFVSGQRQRLLGLVMSAQEDERERIAAGIHDDSVQAVAAVGLRLGALRDQLHAPDAPQILEAAQAAVVDASARLRSLLFDLGLPGRRRESLLAAVRAYLEHVKDGDGIDFELEGELDPEPDPELRAFLYRLVQELLMNVRKHSDARRVTVALRREPGEVVVIVQDDGAGFDPAEALRPRPGHLGLAALRERVELAGGVTRIDSRTGQGARIELRIPAGGAHTSFG